MGRRRSSDQIDWESVEAEYRLGQCSLRQMGRLFKVEPSAIGRHARKHAWVQDKAFAVRARMGVLVAESGSQVSGPKATPKATPLGLDVEVAATVKMNALLRHRNDLRRASAMVIQLLAELESISAPDAGSSSADSQGTHRLRGRRPIAFMTNIESLAARAKILRALADAMCKVITMEREVFGFNAREPLSDGPLVIIRDFTGRGDPDAPSVVSEA